MNKIKQRIHNCLVGDEELPLPLFLQIQKESQGIIASGQEQDADAVLYATKFDGLVFVVLFVGRSMLQGHELRTYFEQYFSNAKGVEFHLPKIIDYLYHDISGGNEAIMVLREKHNHQWRSFNPLLNIDQIYAEVS